MRGKPVEVPYGGQIDACINTIKDSDGTNCLNSGLIQDQSYTHETSFPVFSSAPKVWFFSMTIFISFFYRFIKFIKGWVISSIYNQSWVNIKVKKTTRLEKTFGALFCLRWNTRSTHMSDKSIKSYNLNVLFKNFFKSNFAFFLLSIQTKYNICLFFHSKQ